MTDVVDNDVAQVVLTWFVIGKGMVKAQKYNVPLNGMRYFRVFRGQHTLSVSDPNQPEVEFEVDKRGGSIFPLVGGQINRLNIVVAEEYHVCTVKFKPRSSASSRLSTKR